MANTDRIINQEQGERIINGLKAIADSMSDVPMTVAIPVLEQSYFTPDGNIHEIEFSNINDGRTLITGTTAASAEGYYIAYASLKFATDTWVDGTTEKKKYMWSIGDKYPGDKGWATATDAMIVQLVQAADDGDIDLTAIGWSIGDERVVNLNAIASGTYNNAHAAQQATLVLMDYAHYELTDQSYYGQKCHFVVGFKNGLSEYEKMEDTNTNANGWHNSRGRKCCDAIFNMIPSALQPIFKKFKVKTASAGGSATASVTEYTAGKLALFANMEVFGSAGSSATTEANELSQIEYYKVSANRIKTRGDIGSADNWWLRSPSVSGATAFCDVANNGTAHSSGASNEYLFAPFGCL